MLVRFVLWTAVLACLIGSAKASPVYQDSYDYSLPYTLSIPIGEPFVDPPITESDLEQANDWGVTAFENPAADLICYEFPIDIGDVCAPKAGPTAFSWVSDLGGEVNPPYPSPKVETPEPGGVVFWSIVLGIVLLFLAANKLLQRRKQ